MEEQINLFNEELKQDNESGLKDENNEDISSDAIDDTEKEIIESEDFSDKPKGKHEFEKIKIEDDFPENGMTLTIESVEPQKVYTTDKPLSSKFGQYFKKKLILNFAEDFNGKKLRELVPSVFYRIENDKSVPNLPKACTKDDLTDNFTSKLAKVRYLYNTTFDVPEDLSDKDFIEGLVGKQVKVTKHIGKWKENGIEKQFAELVINSFITA